MSRLCLKVSTEHPDKLRKSEGRQLKSDAPLTWKEDDLSSRYLERLPLDVGMTQRRPVVSLVSAEIPQLGTFPSSTFQVVSILYRSKRRCTLFILNVCQSLPVVQLLGPVESVGKAAEQSLQVLELPGGAGAPELAGVVQVGLQVSPPQDFLEFRVSDS